MELLQLKYFQMIARYENVTQAAHEYNIPQSAMSQALARLEKELGNVRLFDRKNNRIYLNENGKAFLNYVNEALDTLDLGVQNISISQDQITGPIRLLVKENSRFVIWCVSEFSKSYPDVNFFICHDYYSDEDSNYDICIAATPFFKQMKKAVPLIREEMILAVCDQHPLADRDVISLAELKNEKFITQSPKSALYMMTMEKCRDAGFEPRICISCDDAYFIRKYISQNMGIAISPSVSWAGRFRDNTKLIHIIEPEIYTTSYLLWNEKKYQSPAVKAFRRFLKQQSLLISGNLINT